MSVCFNKILLVASILFKLVEMLKKEESRVGGRKLKESDYLDAFEKVCEGKTWEK